MLKTERDSVPNSSPSGGKMNIFTKTKNFFQEVRKEMASIREIDKAAGEAAASIKTTMDKVEALDYLDASITELKQTLKNLRAARELIRDN